MNELSPNSAAASGVPLESNGRWPGGVARGLLVFKRDAVAVWAGTGAEQTPVAVTVLEPGANDAAARAFVDAARRIEPAVPAPGVLPVSEVDPDGRWVLHSPVLGALADFQGLGWNLARKLELFSALCRVVEPLHEAGRVHGALTPRAVALDEAMRPLLVSRGGDATWGAGEGLEYLAPEGIRGERPTVRFDVFSLGRVLEFLLLEADLPLEADAVPRLDALAGAPPGLVRIVRRATMADPELRYGAIAEFLADVCRYGDAEHVGVGLPAAVPEHAPAPSPSPDSARRARHGAPSDAAAHSTRGGPHRSTTQDVAGAPSERAARAKSDGRAAPGPNARKRLLVVLSVVLAGMVALAYGDFFRISRWRARRALAAASGPEKGPAFARLVALGDREMTRANLVGADLSRAPLSGVSLREADLSAAKLDGADLGAADLTGALFFGASAVGANLTEARVTAAQGFDTVACDENTLPPAAWHCASNRLTPAGDEP